jgi:SAM-dependent methyltransferase
MRRQRPVGTAPCLAASAEALPFADGTFDAAMAVLTDHHWNDPIAGLREMQRVARRVVLFQWDNTWLPRYWLVRDYVPELGVAAARRPSLADRAEAIGASMEPVPVPWDCVDGFFHCHWRRPTAYLDAEVRQNTSVWARLGDAIERRAVDALATDLHTSRWHERNAALIDLDEADLGARVLTAQR